jgi:hypothetical protein
MENPQHPDHATSSNPHTFTDYLIAFACLIPAAVTGALIKVKLSKRFNETPAAWIKSAKLRNLFGIFGQGEPTPDSGELGAIIVNLLDIKQWKSNVVAVSAFIGTGVGIHKLIEPVAPKHMKRHHHPKQGDVQQDAGTVPTKSWQDELEHKR